MKKTTLVIFAAIAILSIGCKKEKEGKVLSPDEQKDYIETVAVEAINLIDFDYWKPTADFIVGTEKVASNCETDKSFEDFTDAFYEAFDKGDHKTVYDFSTLKGHFFIDNNAIKYEKASKFSADWKLEDGSACKLTGAVTSSKKEILVAENTRYDDNGTEYVEEEWVVIPTKVTVKATKGGKTMGNLDLATDFSIKGDFPDPATDKISVTAGFSAGDYKVSVTRAKYSPTEIATTFNFNKGKKQIFKFDLLAKGKLSFEEDGDPDLEKTTGTVKVSGNVLNKVKLTGTLNWSKYVALAKEQKDPKTLEEAQAIAKDMESIVKIVLNCGNRDQARLGFEAIADTEQEGAETYSIEPVVRFTDGSAYQLPKEYYTEDSFEDVFEAFSALTKKINDYLESINSSENQPK